MLKRTLFSPRWAWLRKVLGPLVLPAPPEAQWLRVVLDRETQRLVTDLVPSRLNTLEISGRSWDRVGYFRSYTSVDFPDFDVCRDVLDRRFDLIIAEQVFEHLQWPLRAARNVHAMLAPGGVFLMATPFLVRIHEHPIDCTRWTPDGLRYLLIEAGFPEHGVSTWSWGNRACVKANLKRWQTYWPWLHSLDNEPDVPVVVWAVARKPS